MRVNGLYGHVRGNDLRSVALFAGFVLAFHVLAALALVVPLAMLDPDHAPLYGWAGYFTRWVPIMTLVGAVLFAAQMFWHVRTVRRRTDFRFVDSHDESRLCRIVEPLAIAAGLPTPYVGVIDSPAMNAFACGIRQKEAVLVFTRGLIDGLDDDELAAVAAHEIAHIANGDIRLIAATNVCLDTLKLLQQRPHPKRVNRIWEAMLLPILAISLPLMVVLILATLFLRRLAVDGSHLTRFLIASAREFIADAEAVRLTHNPSALVSALNRIDGRSEIPGLAAGQDAMMIDGAHDGPFATHPTIAERVAAIISVTGSMALIAPARRDTRSSELRSAGGFGRRAVPALEQAFGRRPRQTAVSAAARVASGGEYNRLGLTSEMSLGAVAALAAFLYVNAADLTKPSALAAAFDPAPVRVFFLASGQGMQCQMHAIGWLVGVLKKPTDCNATSMNAMLKEYRGEGGILGMMADSMSGMNEEGTFGTMASADRQLTEVRTSKCFHTDGYSVGDRGLRKVDEEVDEHDNINLPRWLAYGSGKATAVMAAAPGERDAAILDYFELRKTHGQGIHRFFGDPGIEVAMGNYTRPEHVQAVAALRERLADPAFAPDLTPVERAELELLAYTPGEFVTCNSRRRTARLAKETASLAK